LVDDRREEDGEMYARRLGNERPDSEGGVGERERTERGESESDASKEGTGLRGELGSLSGVQ
jgi:hypothetical protein